MKVVLLALSGDLSRWRDKLAQLYPDCSLELISRAEFETGSHIKRLKSLRALRPDVLAIATERLPWQRGQNLFMVFGALAGAREVLMIDAHGGLVRKSRASLLAGAPVRLGRETLTSVNEHGGWRDEASVAGTNDVARVVGGDRRSMRWRQQWEIGAISTGCLCWHRGTLHIGQKRSAVRRGRGAACAVRSRVLAG